MTTDRSGLANAKLMVMSRVPYIQKERKPGLNYTFAGEAAILEKLHPVLREAGLCWAVTGCELVASEQYTTKSGAGMNRVIVKATYTLTHADSGQGEQIQALGEGADHGDKATSKAMTSALKYALRQTFLIETGDDPDHTPSDHQERRPVAQPARQQPQQSPPTDPPKAAEFATVGDLFAAMRKKADPPTAVSLADRVNWCDKELARLGASAFKAGSFVAAVCKGAGCANLQQLAGMHVGEKIAAAWRAALGHVETFTHAKPAAPPPATVGELWALLGKFDPPKDGGGLVKRIDSVEANLGRLVADHGAGDCRKAVAEFLKTDDAGLAQVAGNGLVSGWNRVMQFVKACETNPPAAR